MNGHQVVPNWQEIEAQRDLDLKNLARQRRIPIGFKVGAWLLICFGIAGNMDYQDAKGIEAERASIQERRESYALTHPLSCAGIWIKSCADFNECQTTCIQEKP